MGVIWREGSAGVAVPGRKTPHERFLATGGDRKTARLAGFVTELKVCRTRLDHACLTGTEVNCMTTSDTDALLPFVCDGSVALAIGGIRAKSEHCVDVATRVMTSEREVRCVDHLRQIGVNRGAATDLKRKIAAHI
jgi:hypothetical protein